MNDTTTKVLESLYCDGQGRLAELVNSLPDSEKELLVSPLISILQSNSSHERINAIYALGLLGPLAWSAVPAIIRAPDDSRLANVGWEVTKTLPKIGADYAVPALIEALGSAPAEGSTNWDSRAHDARIMEHLAAFGPDARSAAPHLAAYLGTHTAEDALAKIGPAAVPAVLKEIQKGSNRRPQVYINAADVLAAVGNAASQALSEAFDAATTPEARLSILRIFQHGPTPARRIELPPELYSIVIENCFADEDRHVSIEAQKMLTSTRPPRPAVIPALRTCMSNTNPRVRANAAAAILRHVPDDSNAVEILLSLLGDDRAQVRLGALQALTDAHSTSERLVPALMRAWQDPSSEIRKQATECSAQSGYLGRFVQDQIGAASVAQLRPTAEADVSEPNRPLMPSDDFIKQAMVQQFGEKATFHSAHRSAQPQFLKKHILIQVTGDGFGRIYMGMMSRPANGLYAYDGRQLLYLNGLETKGYIGDILRAERVQLDQIDPLELALFFNGILLQGFTVNLHHVLEPSAIVESEPSITKPLVKADGSGGWIVNFWTKCEIGGCLGVQRSLHEHAVLVSQQYEITYEQRLTLQSYFNHQMQTH